MRLNVEFVTPANDAYQATAAVTRPAQPPAFVHPVESANAPIHSNTKVTVKATNTPAIAPVVRRLAIVM